MDNYEFCANWALQEVGAGRQVLDYGCGCGELVVKLRDRSVDAHGCDVFYEGGDFSKLLQQAAPYIRRMESDRIPFEDATFDAVISNQVLEHVPDIEVVAAEIARVLKPGGVCLHLFPDRSVIVEPHVKVPLLHWFPRGAGWRLPWTMATRALRYGRAAWPLREVSEKRIAWVDSWTHYRTAAEIRRVFARHFARIEHIEEQLVDARRRVPLPRPLKRGGYRLAAGSVMIVHGR